MLQNGHNRVAKARVGDYSNSLREGGDFRCQCPARDCDELIVGSQRYCEGHDQPWKGPRTASSHTVSTAAWKKIRAGILARDNYYCQIQDPRRCLGRATTVDKIIPASRRPDLALDATNLRAACRPCNEHKGRTTDRQNSADGL
ncbi:HNH endonuclease [Mycobacterium sp. 20091114027_K0903767]|nr:HNH endonuclease [Mycobacterium sp. 20091114027_K0903767]